MSWEAISVSTLRSMIQPFVTTVEDPYVQGTSLQCCLWSFVKKVRVCQKSRILEQGIIADCPGTTYKNRLGLESTGWYLQECGQNIVVNKMDRAVGHASLHNHINKAFRGRRSGSMIVICTRSDDINMNAKQKHALMINEQRAMMKIDNEEEAVD